MDSDSSDLLASLLNCDVVLDLQSMYVCVGTFLEFDHRYLVMTNADLHDLRDTNTTRERYIIDSKIHGIRANRERVLVQRADVVGISLLEDVIS